MEVWSVWVPEEALMWHEHEKEMTTEANAHKHCDYAVEACAQTLLVQLSLHT